METLVTRSQLENIISRYKTFTNENSSFPFTALKISSYIITHSPKDTIVTRYCKNMLVPRKRSRGRRLSSIIPFGTFRDVLNAKLVFGQAPYNKSDLLFGGPISRLATLVGRKKTFLLCTAHFLNRVHPAVILRFEFSS